MNQVETRHIPPLVWRRIAYYRRTTRLVQFITQHPDQPLTLEKASAIACMERTSFSRFFRRRIGLCFCEFLSAYRIDLAMTEMLKSNSSLAEVARAVGFNCMATFERHFKKETGMSPSTYRAKELAKRQLVVPAGRGDIARSERTATVAH